MDLTAADIRRQRFEQVRRGFDPQEVGVFLERVAGIIAIRDKEIAGNRAEMQRLERALDDARATEEAVRLTMIAAPKAKDEVLAGANEDAGHLLESARSEAEASVIEARRDALMLIEESRKDAEQLLGSARREHADLLERVEIVRRVVKKAGNLLKGMASGALEDLVHAAALLEGADAGFDSADFDMAGDAVQNPESAVSVSLDPVDRLLEQLREVGS